MKKTIIAICCFWFCGGIAVFAQTEYEIKMAELRARRGIAKEMIGNGGEDKLISLENEANAGVTPCTLFDDSEWFTAFNQKEGFPGDPKLANSLLRECQLQLRAKLGGRVQQVLRDYTDQMDTENGSYVREHIESAGEMVIDKEIGETMEHCRNQTNPDPQKGTIIMYMSIRVSKKSILDSLVKECIEDAPSQSTPSNAKADDVRRKEEKFRESAKKVLEME